MKIKLMSDLHMEFGSKFYFEPMLDTILVLAGDICNDLFALDIWLGQICPNFQAVLMVAGNHEFYGHEWANTIKELRTIDKSISNFYFLENDFITFNDITFIGATLWSNPAWGVFHRISDHHVIAYNGRKLTSDQVSSFNKYSSEYIKYQLENIKGKKIVITHFGPDPSLMHPKWQKYSDMNTYFWSTGFTDYFQYADLWLYGHTHDSGNQKLDTCQCICNPYGYYNYEPNFDFDQNLILEI